MQEKIRKRLIEIRKKHKITQIKLAEIFKISQPNISRYERGLIEPSLNVIIMYMEYFHVTFDYIMCLTDKPHKALNAK